VRAVLDTNVVISALIFRQGPTVTLRQAWIAGQFKPLTDRPCVDELIRALSYPKFQLDPSDIQRLLADYLPYTEVVATADAESVEVPICRDPDDQKFLVLAELGRADILVTGDKALLDLAETTRFVIESPGDMLDRLTSS
jgi:putative PIN family toxin of toxin-antitoxin system